MAKTDSVGPPHLDPIEKIGPGTYIAWSEVQAIQAISFGCCHVVQFTFRGGTTICSGEHDEVERRDNELERFLAEWRRRLLDTV